MAADKTYMPCILLILGYEENRLFGLLGSSGQVGCVEAGEVYMATGRKIGLTNGPIRHVNSPDKVAVVHFRV
jgi:hypothetical protein